MKDKKFDKWFKENYNNPEALKLALENSNVQQAGNFKSNPSDKIKATYITTQSANEAKKNKELAYRAKTYETTVKRVVIDNLLYIKIHSFFFFKVVRRLADFLDEQSKEEIIANLDNAETFKGGQSEKSSYYYFQAGRAYEKAINKSFNKAIIYFYSMIGNTKYNDEKLLNRFNELEKEGKKPFNAYYILVKEIEICKARKEKREVKKIKKDGNEVKAMGTQIRRIKKKIENN